jgi:hypothetical protein
MRHFVLALGLAAFGCGASGPGEHGNTGSGGTEANAGTGGTTSNAGTTSGGSGGTSGPGGTAGNGGTNTTSGGTSGAGGSAGGSGGDGPIPHMPGECNELAEVGVWENITPPDVPLENGNHAASRFVVNPQNTAILYLGTNRYGIHKTTDCGASWEKANTGTNGSAVDQGMQWAMAIDHVDPEVLYVNTGYGDVNSGVWKSTNGGVDWAQFIPDEYMGVLIYSFASGFALDPTNHQHLLVTPHFTCNTNKVDGKPTTEHCQLETTDAGETWSILEDTPAVGEGGGQWMQDENTWFWSSYFGGLSRTTNAGASWQQVVPNGHYANTDGVSPDGGQTWFTGAEFNVQWSTDGGATWDDIDGSPGTTFMACDADNLFSVRGSSFHSASTSDPTQWTELPSPTFPFPDNAPSWELKYDPDHHLLYSLHASSGIWRMRTE